MILLNFSMARAKIFYPRISLPPDSGHALMGHGQP